MTATAPGMIAGLAERAVHTARAHCAADPHGFHRRHDNPDQWSRWAHRARLARTIAAALQIGADAVLVTDDPDRVYRTPTGRVPGDLITVTDQPTGRTWRFVPDLTTSGDWWLLLDRCPDCDAEVPVTRIACLVDLGEYLDRDGEIHLADEARDEAIHQPGCHFGLPSIDGGPLPATPDPHRTDGAAP